MYDYIEKQKVATANYEINKKISDKISVTRLIIFFVFLTTLILYFVFLHIALLIVALIFLIGFVVFVIIHEIYDKKCTFYKNMLEVINDYVHRIDGTWKNVFLDSGQGYFPKEDYLYDLDIAGKGSLFTFLNIGRTSGGKRKLANRLSNQELNNDELSITQQAVKELSQKYDFTIDFQSRLKSIRNNTLLNFNSEDTKIRFWPYYLVGGIATLLFLTIIIISILSELSIYFIAFPIGLSLLVNYVFFDINSKNFEETQTIMYTCTCLNEVFSAIGPSEFETPILNEYNQTIQTAIAGLKKTKKWIGYDTLRQSFLTMVITNCIFPLSLIFINNYQSTIIKYNENIKDAVAAFESFESLISLAILAQVRGAVVPTITDDVRINAKGLYHPLLNENQAVPNDFNTTNGVNIITGSNMSGKTSFMRTLGINLVLLNAGGMVCATKLSAPLLKIFTSMRVTDDISKGISTFYGEIIRIKKALEYNSTDKKMITFIDEIFKGTNSNDRIKGAKTLIEKLNGKNSIVVITTHDFELCDIEGENVKNYNFSEHYVDGEIAFDYTIKPGRCQTTNAEYLMRKAGII